jgi:hypothetical protein
MTSTPTAPASPHFNGPPSDPSPGSIGPIVAGDAARSVAEEAVHDGSQRRVDLDAEADYWRGAYVQRPYLLDGASFADYGPAYAFGAQAHDRLSNRPFDEAEPDMAKEWDQHRGSSTLNWEHAKEAARDAWARVKEMAGVKP